MRLVMKQEMASLSARAEIATRSGSRRKHAAVGRWMAGSLMRRRTPTLHVHAVAKPLKAIRSAPLSWEEHASTTPSALTTAWCADLATMQAAILAGAPLIVVPHGATGTALYDAATTKLGDAVSLTRIECSTTPLSVPQLVAALVGGSTGEGSDADQQVVRVLAERGQGARHLVIAVNGADNLSSEALVFLQRLTEIRMSNAPAIQVAFAGGARFYALLADERFDVIREEVRSEVGQEFEYDPNAPEITPMAGSQRAGVAAGLMVVFCLITGPFVPWGALPSFGGQPAIQMVAPVPQTVAAAQPDPAIITVAASTRIEDLATGVAQQRREFEANLAFHSRRRFSQAERDRMFNSYLARHQGPALHPGVRPADRHV